MPFKWTHLWGSTKPTNRRSDSSEIPVCPSCLLSHVCTSCLLCARRVSCPVSCVHVVSPVLSPVCTSCLLSCLLCARRVSCPVSCVHVLSPVLSPVCTSCLLCHVLSPVLSPVSRPVSRRCDEKGGKVTSWRLKRVPADEVLVAIIRGRNPLVCVRFVWSLVVLVMKVLFQMQ